MTDIIAMCTYSSGTTHELELKRLENRSELAQPDKTINKLLERRFYMTV